MHGSTVATNTILEKKGARVGLLTTEGFRDSLEIRRGIRENQWDHRAPFPEVLAPRYLRLPVRGRIAADGTELAPLVAEDVDAAARVFGDEGVESVAVCLFNSFLDGAHERAAGAQLARSWSGKWVSLSSEVMPTMGEYERSSTAVVNAYIAPKVTSYLSALDQQLRQLGLPRSLLLLQSNGGAVSVEPGRQPPGDAGPVGSGGRRRRAQGLRGAGRGGQPDLDGDRRHQLRRHGDGQGRGAGRRRARRSTAITSPRRRSRSTPSAPAAAPSPGSTPPACCMSARKAPARDPGPRPTGWAASSRPSPTPSSCSAGCGPGPLAGGAVTLDGRLARQAIENKLAQPLGLSVEEAAAGVIRLLEQNLLHAVERLSIERGHNPATFTLVAAGGAGPMHGADVARALGCKRALLPRAAGAFCALGMLQSDVRQDYLQVFLADLDKVDRAASRQASRSSRRAPARRWPAKASATPMRRSSASSTCATTASNGRCESRSAPASTRRPPGRPSKPSISGCSATSSPAAASTSPRLRVVGRGRLDWTPPAARAGAGRPAQAARAAQGLDRCRPTAGARCRSTTAPIFGPGCTLDGPLLIEERTTTAFVGPRDRLEVDARDDFLVHVGAIS